MHKERQVELQKYVECFQRFQNLESCDEESRFSICMFRGWQLRVSEV